MLEIEYAFIGKSDLRVSRLGLGTHQFGASWGVADKEKVKEIVNKALDLGINFIDTAETYNDGIAEKYIGEILKQRGDRDEIVIATKVSSEHLRYREVIKAANKSLERLQTSYIDLYQIHWPDPYVPVKETIKALDRLVDKGKIRYIGLSNFPPCLVKEAIQASKHEIISNQVLYNLLERDIEKEILPKMRKLKISIIAYSPLAMGFLTPKYYENVNISEDDPRQFIPWIRNQENFEYIKTLISAIQAMADKYSKTPAQIVLNWLLYQEGIFPIFGVTKIEQLIENIGAMGWRLSNEDWLYLKRVSDSVRKQLSYW